MGYHIYMYMITIAYSLSHKGANTLYTTHMCTPAITNVHTYTHYNICMYYYHIYMYMIRRYQTPMASHIIHIYTVHTILVLTHIITCYNYIIIARDIIQLIVEHDNVPFFSRIASQITNIITIGCHVTIDMTIMFKSGQDLRLSVLMCSIVNVLLCGDM